MPEIDQTQISFWLSKEDHAKLHAVTAYAERTQSDVLRILIRVGYESMLEAIEAGRSKNDVQPA